MKNILVTGAAGFIGRKLIFDDSIVTFTDVMPSSHIRRLDVTDRAAVDDAFTRYAPDVVVNLAAMAGAELCERNPERAYEVNAKGAWNVAEACRIHGASLVHFSSSSVYGTFGTVDESKPTVPFSVYGKTKLLGEQAVRASGCDAVVLRPFTVVGASPRRDLVIGKWADAVRRGQPMIVYSDTWRQYTPSSYVIRVVKELANIGKTGYRGLPFDMHGTLNVTTEALAKEFIEVKKLPKAKILCKQSPTFNSVGIRSSSHRLNNVLGVKTNGRETMTSLRDAITSA